MILELDRLIELLEVVIAGVTFPIHILTVDHWLLGCTLEPLFNAGLLIVRPGKPFMIGMQHKHILRRQFICTGRYRLINHPVQHNE
ncbi:hypothetical protein D3C85_1580450 [compost metagenome]